MNGKLPTQPADLLATDLRRICGHDSRSVDGCVTCEAADCIEALSTRRGTTRPDLLAHVEVLRAIQAQYCQNDVKWFAAIEAAIESLAAHRGEAALWVNLEQLAAARHDIAQHRMSYVRAWNTDYPPEGATQPLYDHPPQAQAGAGDIEAMVDCMARVVAEHAGEDFDTIGQFAQSILLDTQRAALLAALEAK